MPDKDVRFLLSARDGTAAVFGGVLGRLRGLQSAAGALNASFGRVAGVLGGAAVGATFTAFVGHIVSSIDRLNDLRDATGASVPNLSALEDIAVRTGTGFEGMSGTLIKFNKALQEAEPGSRTERVLAQIGLSAKELRDLDPAEALRRTAVALGTYATDGDKARIVQELFGKSIKEAGPFLAELAAKTRLVGTVTSEQADQAERFNKELATLQKNATDAGRALVSDLLPALNRIFEAQRTGGFSAAGGALLGLSQQDREGNALRNAQNALAQAQAAYTKAAESGPDLVDALFGSPEKRTAKLNALEGDLIKAQETVDRLLRQQADRQAQAESDNEISRRFGAGRRPIGRVKDPEKDKKSASLTAEQIAKLQVDAEEQAAKDAAEAWDIWGKYRLKEAEERAAAEKKMWQQIFDEIDAEQERAIEEGKAFTEKKVDELSDFAQEARRNLQDFTGDALSAGLEGEFGRIDRLFGQLLKRMVAQALAADLNRALFGKTGLGGDTGLLGFLFQLGGARAEGGPVSGRTPYLVGERGPEIFVPGVSGQVVSNRAAGGLGGGITIAPTYNTSIDARTDAAQVQRLVMAANAQSNKQLVDQLNAAGLLRRTH